MFPSLAVRSGSLQQGGSSAATVGCGIMRFFSIREGGGKFSEREKAMEDKFFHEMEKKLLQKLSQDKEFIKKTAQAQAEHAAAAEASDGMTPEQFAAFKKEMMDKLESMEKKVKK